jgi:FixJ family two-component response regulator
MRLGADSGEELIEFIRERKDALNVDTPILVISGHLDKPLIGKIAKKIQGALVKPFDMNALLESVKKHAG